LKIEFKCFKNEHQAQALPKKLKSRTTNNEMRDDDEKKKKKK